MQANNDLRGYDKDLGESTLFALILSFILQWTVKTKKYRFEKVRQNPWTVITNCG